jgi:hypothetical protein
MYACAEDSCTRIPEVIKNTIK